MINVTVQKATPLEGTPLIRVSVLILDERTHSVDIPEDASPAQVSEALRLLADAVEEVM